MLLWDEDSYFSILSFIILWLWLSVVKHNGCHKLEEKTTIIMGVWNCESNLKVVQRGCIVCKRSSGEMVRLFGGNSFDALFFWIFRCFWTPPNTSRWIRTLRATGWWENMRWSWNWNMSQIFSRSVQTNESSVSLLSKVVSFSCIKSCQFPFFQKLSVSLLSKVVSFTSFKSC